MFPSVPRCPSLHDGYSLAVPSFRGCRWSGLVQTRASGVSRFGVLSVSWSRSLVPACDGTGSFCCSGRWGTGNPYWALFARLTPLLPSARGSSSRELGVGRVAEAAVAPCVVSSSESECCELL
ncbi:hypothetical protein Taro_032671 [Colocasia esculenta]|uniref:Uncharacterized protein n=1 Tax=Colocasia esculenta TaxID=4460 RepID=A0A843VT87_COLES|nr:hypothetical protein [Colocasia esculenta]